MRLRMKGVVGRSLLRASGTRLLPIFSSAISIEPNRAVHYRHRGMAYRGKNDLDKAINDLTKAISLDRNDARAWCTRGYLRREREK